MSTAEATAVSLRELAENSNAWPFEEAKKIVARLKRKPKDEVIFETGYGPSGLPHIGTFGEVARTTMVRHAFRVLTDDKVKTRLIAFSDDMDGLRKVPDNVPNKDMLAEDLGKPLTRVRDPFGTHPSFGQHNNARLRAFLDTFGFDYEFMSSTDCYKSGRFDAALLTVLERFDAVMNIMLPSLREERAQTYSPFLPISPRTGVVLQVPILERDAKAGTITYDDPDTGERMVTPVTGGQCKLQWKPDWAMRWVALGVDYEMSGKDLIDSVKLSGEIARALGSPPPEGFNYELFLDEKGQKISKSKGNGLTIEEWLRYASPESLSLFMYREPKAAKRLYFDVIPRNVDDYQQFLDGYQRQDGKQRLSNPVWHIHSGNPPPARHAAHVPADADAGRRLRMPRTPRRCGASSAATGRASRRRRIPGSTRWSAMRSTTIATSSRRPSSSASRARASAWRSPTCAMRCRNCRRTRRPRRSRTWSTRSAGASRSSTR